MSSERWVEPCSEGQAEEKQQGEEVEREEEEKVEVPCSDNHTAGSLRQEERPSSLDNGGMQEVTSEGGLEQVQREEKQTEERKRFTHMTVKQQGRDRGAGVCQIRCQMRCE